MLSLCLQIFLVFSNAASLPPSKGNGLEIKVERLKIGESNLVNQINSIDFLTSIPAKYTLTRLDEKQYESELVIDFFTKDSTITKNDLINFRNRVQVCLAQSSPFLNGPNDETLQIKLAPVNSTFPENSMTRIEVGKGFKRENSKQYNLSSDCPTLIHEILHLHGLVDEYPEEFSTDQFKILSCRHVGVPSSIMYDYQVAFERTQFRNMDIWSYEMHGLDEEVIRNEIAVKGNTVFPIESLKKLGATQIKKVKSVFRNSLLSSQQFNVIVHPGDKTNKLYYACAANSARLIPPKGTIINGQPQDPKMACIQTPNECENPEIWSGTPEKLIIK